MLKTFISNNQLDLVFEQNAVDWYMPLADRLVERQSHFDETFFVGINGCQGSGKSTLAMFLAEYIQSKYPLSIAVLSLDDFYLSLASRKEMAKHIHPLFTVRGAPGTHDTQLIANTFKALSKPGLNVALPIFNKALDNPVNPKQWPRINAPVDMVLMEGWCWGVPAQPIESLAAAVNTLEQQQDPKAIWRNKVNEYLRLEYEPLYDHMDLWLMLKAPDFSKVYKWRLEQENKLAQYLQSSNKDNTCYNLMSAEQVCHFVDHYQRLTEYAIDVMPKRCDYIYHLDGERKILHLDSTTYNH